MQKIELLNNVIYDDKLVHPVSSQTATRLDRLYLYITIGVRSHI